MTLPPAGWYDDPEHPTQYRYWDGDTWTPHRAPKTVPASPGNEGPSGIIGWGWDLLVRNWVTLLVIAVITFAVMAVLFAVAAVAASSALDPGLFDIVDRISEPGFDPTNDPADDAFIDSIEFDPSIGVLAAIAVAAIAAAIAGGLAWATATLRVASVNAGTPLAGGECFALALRRLPRWVGIYLLWMLVAVLCLVPVVLVFAVAITAAPPLLILLVPGLIGAVIYAWPYGHLAATALVLAPVGDPPFRRLVALVRPRWGAVAVRVLLLNLVLLALGIATSVAGAIPLAGFALALPAQAAQYAFGITTNVALYDWTGGPLDPSVTGADQTS